MHRKTLILFFTLISIFACSEKKEIKFKKTDFKDLSGYSSYILPQYRNSLLKKIPYGNQYRIAIDIDRDSSTADCQLNILYYNDSGEDLSDIQFRLLMNKSDHLAMTIHSVEMGELPLEFSLSEDNSILIIPLMRKLVPEKTADIKIQYHMDFSQDPDYYFDFSRIDKRGFSIPHFFPVASVIHEGLWENDPIVYGGDLLSAESSWFMVEIITDDKVVIVTSGREISSEIRKGKQKKVFAAGPVRDFYICGDVSFIPQVTLSGETDVISFSRNKDSSISAKAAGISSSALALFNSTFGIYPYSKLKITSLPMSSRGVEFPGLIAIKEELYEDPEGDLFESTIVHEVAHQWFYAMLGNNQLKEPWLDEGLAQYALWLYYREYYGPSAALNLFNSFTERWGRVNRAEIPINKEVSFYKGEEYSAIIYGRAPLFLIELRNTIGVEKFHSFLRHLIRQYSHKQINTEDFRTELIHFTGSSADPLFEKYFD